MKILVTVMVIVLFASTILNVFIYTKCPHDTVGDKSNVFPIFKMKR